ncbi:MAG: DNA polymerase I [Butyrivibrio sp.]|nr:DNA polymerase I [Butyrivibrio sp.]
MDDKTLLLIDGHNILFRAFYGLPDLTNAEGRHTGAVYGFLSILFRLLEEEKPAALIVAFDSHGPTFRHELYPAYKGTRQEMPETLREQVPLIREVLDAMRIRCVAIQGLEADDILGTLARRGEAAGYAVSLVSGDRDLLQIASERTRIRLPHTKGGRTQIEDYYAADVARVWQVSPAQFIELKALMGDSSDNIPGVPMVGPKTATELMTRYGSIEEIYAHLDEIPKKSIRETLAGNRELCELSRTLATIHTAETFDCDLETARYDEMYNPESYALFRTLGFRNYLSRFDDAMTQASAGEQPEAESALQTYREITDPAEAETAVKGIRQGMSTNPSAFVGYAVLYNEEQPPQPIGVALHGSGEETVFLRCRTAPESTEGITATWLGQQLAALSAAGRLATFDAKPGYRLFEPAGMEGAASEMLPLSGIRGSMDILLGAYLLNPLKSDYQPEDVALEHMGQVFRSRIERFGKTPLSQVSASEQAAYAAELAQLSARTASVLEQKLAENGELRLLQDVELPLSYILYDMERIGIIARREALAEYGSQLTQRITELEQSIHVAAGEDFNINSPKQLGEILFEKMGLKGGKKTKTGYSTAADVLEKLAPAHPIVADILEYRGLTKLKSTYADGLADVIAADGRIHTTFKQTITATGRISSAEPNLQNIPMRTELGRLIRKVFVPQEGYTFADADYSQIELRILAHMSGDAALIAAYHEGRDIHRITASKVFGIPFDEVTDRERRAAKAVNFGIVYGISAFGLSENLSISREEAQTYMKGYLATYPGVQAYQERAVAEAKERGYAVTLYGRRRPMPELKAANYMQRQFGERVAMNAPIQGTAADIMKLAMLRVWRRLRAEHLQSRMILQIHDELLIETAPGEEAAVGRILTEEMSAAATLAVPLEVDCHTGSRDWYESK